jgi:predicted RNase H-like nuclease (RuvC/YqgF family)
MTEATLDAYINQLNVFKTLCNSLNTTVQQLEAEITTLNALDTQIDMDCLNMTLPPQTFSHFQKYLAVEVQRSRKADIQASVIKLINSRIENEQQETENKPLEEALLYIKETNNIKDYLITLSSSCDCMNERALITYYLR